MPPKLLPRHFTGGNQQHGEISNFIAAEMAVTRFVSVPQHILNITYHSPAEYLHVHGSGRGHI